MNRQPTSRQPTSSRPTSSRPMNRRTAIAAAAAALAVTAALAGCGSSGGSAASKDQETITLYNGQHEQTADGLVTAFEQKTGIKVNIQNDDEDTLANLVAVQGAHSPADVIYTENSPALQFLQDKGLLSKVDSGTLSQVPAQDSSAQGDWIGVSARVSVMIYNPALISKSQLPTSILQLANPEYKGKLAFAAGETDFQPIVTAVIKQYGQARALQWLQGVKANAASHIVPDNETITDEVNRGVVAFGVINQYYWYRLRAEIGASGMHSQITYFAPHDPGYVLDVSTAAVIKSSKHQAAAQEFLAFLVSKHGQEIIARATSTEQSYEYPLAAGVTTSAPETPFAGLQPYPITLAELGDGAAAIALLRQTGLL
jgi:iron(III) transport system substrate-binding protein